MSVLCAFSGGKDSQASLIWAVKKFGNKNVKAVFCDTGWEHELTYSHINYCVKHLDVELVTLKSKKYNGMIDLATKKNGFPSFRKRYCTTEFKVIPMIDYVLSLNEDLIIIQGTG